MSEVAEQTRPRAHPCPLCQSLDHRRLPFYYAFKGRKLYGVRCDQCGLTFVSPRPSDREIVEMYSEEYFNSSESDYGAHGPKSYMAMAQEGEGLRTDGARRLDETLRDVRPDRGLLLEVGCGPGFLLKEMQELGWSVRGLELSEYAVQFARTELGLDVSQGAIRQEEFPQGTADAVFLGDVLEHLPEPVESLRVIHSWLRPGGAIAVAVPSTMSLWSARLGLQAYATLGREKCLRIPPYHLMEFVPATLKKTMEAAGFDVRTVRVGAVPISKMGLRGSPVENAGKVALQLAAHTTSRLLNRWGDRILAVGARRG